MSREKQIEEMAKVLDEVGEYYISGLTDCFIKTKWACDRTAEKLYNAGYRKQIKGEWKKVAEKYPRYSCTSCNHLYNKKEYKYCPNCGAKMSEGIADKKYISPEDVRKMTQEEVRQNYKEIQDSMKKWQ